jgi:Leucine-rich repeat (LRR) protein
LEGRLPEGFDTAAIISEIEQLNLSGNQLKDSIPSSLGSLRLLINLDLSSNQFSYVPPSFGDFGRLKTLWLSYNKLKKIPKEIGFLPDLRSLFLTKNEISEIPEEIARLSQLNYLHISDNKISKLPSNFANLSNLEQLYASRNLIKELPIDLQKMQNLEVFVFNSNQVDDLPESIAEMPKLKVLQLVDNKLDFSDLEKLLPLKLSIFDYAPQAKLGILQDTVMQENTYFSIPINIKGYDNVYQWQLNDQNIPFHSYSLEISNVQPKNAGVYTCLITNPKFPKLTLRKSLTRLYLDCNTSLQVRISTTNPLELCSGLNSAMLLVDAKSDEYDIQWIRNEQQILGAYERSYKASLQGEYSVQITTKSGCLARSNKITISTIDLPVSKIQIKGNENILVALTNKIGVQYRWFLDDQLIRNAFDSELKVSKSGYYRLQVIDKEGCLSTSENFFYAITALEDHLISNKIQLYPVPARNVLFLQMDLEEEKQFVIWDTQGRKVAVPKVENKDNKEYKIDIEALRSGVYILEAAYSKGCIHKVFVKE